MIGCRNGFHTRRTRIFHHHRPLPERGWIQFLILSFLYEEPTHGYQLIERMESKGYVRLGRFKTGSIYTILNRMEKRGFLSSREVKSEAGRMRRTYSVTLSGKEALKRGLEHLLHRKKLFDEMEEYYNKHFHNELPDKNKRGER